MHMIMSSALYDKFVNPIWSNESEPKDNVFTLFVVLAFTDYDVASYLIVIMTPYLGLLDYRTRDLYITPRAKRGPLYIDRGSYNPR